MIRSLLKTCLAGFCLFLLPAPEIQARTIHKPKHHHPIEMKMTMGLLGLLGAGTEYSFDGKKIGSYEEFADVIFPLNDPESTRLIHEAGEADLVWLFLLGTGVVIGADVALTYKPVPFINIDFIDRIVSGSVAVQICLIPGSILGAISASNKFNAVQRYNHLVKRGKEAGLGLQPQLFANRDHLGLGLNCRF